ncbi:hypothetical protein RvY_02428 [Ramazzottius varieornatus]|uniref:DDE-1 domain-containing protein n=1 Tax=Ramazzottius varieornatus TaxID=947166 RepID=A0A1D1UJQ4_RAMVA|nr:hypothetical protein RvY_02428 [Ramazzottius varieornatus]
MGKLKNRPPNEDRRPITPAVPQTILQRCAEIIYKMNHGFKAGDLADMYDLSESSIRRIYKERHETETALKTGEVSEESSTDLLALENWFTVDLPKVLMNVDPRNLLNADETGLFWRNVGVKSLIIGRRHETGGRIAKDRITIVLLCSAAGEKFAICVIGTAERPRAFEKNAVHDVTVGKYGFSYYSNSTARMTTAIFNSWLDWLKAEMVKQDRHVLLVVDSFIAHKVSSRSNVTVFEKLPVTNGVEDFVKGLTVFDAVKWAMEARKSVKPSTIVNCFHKSSVLVLPVVVTIVRNQPVDPLTLFGLEDYR